MATSHHYYTLNSIIKHLFKELCDLNSSLIKIYETKEFKPEDFNNVQTMSYLVKDSLTHLNAVFQILNNKSESI